MAYQSYPLACHCKTAQDGEVQGKVSIGKQRKVLRYQIRHREHSKIPSFRLTPRDKQISDLLNTADTERDTSVPRLSLPPPVLCYRGRVQVPSRDSGSVPAAGSSPQLLMDFMQCTLTHPFIDLVEPDTTGPKHSTASHSCFP